MKKNILFFILVILNLNVFVFWQTWNTENFSTIIDQQDQRIENISNDLSLFKNEYKNINQRYKDIADLSSNIIDKWLNRQSLILWLFSSIITIIWIILWVIINSYYKKVKDIKIDSEEILKDMKKWLFDCKNYLSESEGYLQKSENILKETEEIQKEIENYPDKIYERILNAETKYMFDRLKKYPKDISNFFTKLATRQIPNNYFTDFKNGRNITQDYNYIILSYQHMPSEIFLSDDEYWKAFIQEINNVINCAYDIEIEFSSKEILREYIKDTPKHENRFKEYLIWLIKNKKIEGDLYDSLMNSLETAEQKGKLSTLIREIKDSIEPKKAVQQEAI